MCLVYKCVQFGGMVGIEAPCKINEPCRSQLSLACSSCCTVERGGIGFPVFIPEIDEDEQKLSWTMHVVVALYLSLFSAFFFIGALSGSDG